MSKAVTKDERFLLNLFEMATTLGDPTNEVDRFEVAQAMGLRQRGIDSIVRLLAQCNFVKLGSGSNIYLSEGGLTLIKTLRGF